MRRIVIDASVALKWYLDEEEHGQKAMSLLVGYISDELTIIAPSLLEYEVISGLTMAWKKGRIREDKISSAIDGFADLEIGLKNVSSLYPKILHYCKAYGRSVYDASYMAVADDEGIPLVTADKGLYHAARELKWVRWIGDG